MFWAVNIIIILQGWFSEAHNLVNIKSNIAKVRYSRVFYSESAANKTVYNIVPALKLSESQKHFFFVFVIELHRTGTSNPTFLLRKNGKEFVLRHKAPVEVYIGYHKVLIDVDVVMPKI